MHLSDRSFSKKYAIMLKSSYMIVSPRWTFGGAVKASSRTKEKSFSTKSKTRVHRSSHVGPPVLSSDAIVSSIHVHISPCGRYKA